MADNRERLFALRQDHATPVRRADSATGVIRRHTEPDEGGAHFFRQVLMNALRSSPLSALAVASALQVFIFSCWVAALALPLDFSAPACERAALQGEFDEYPAYPDVRIGHGRLGPWFRCHRAAGEDDRPSRPMVSLPPRSRRR